MNWPEPVEKIILYSGADLDALFASWLFVRNTHFARYAKFDFVKIGETWKNQPVDSDPAIVHIDTGKGRFDHHGGKAKTASELMARELGVEGDPALKNLFGLIESYEKAEKQVFYSPSQLITGWYYLYQRNPKVVIERAFELFDILYGQEKHRLETESKSSQVVWKQAGSVKVAVLDGIAELRDWAFENGADVVIWRNVVNETPYYGVQVGRESSVTLEKAAASLRVAEAKVRGLEKLSSDLTSTGELREIPGWYLHESGKLILCGSRKRPLKKNEVSQLSFEKILEINIKNLQGNTY